MGLIDKIRHKLNPEIRKKFHLLFSNHRKGLNYFLSINPSFSCKDSYISLSDFEFGDMRIIVESESEIITYDRQINRTEKLYKWSSDYKDNTQKSRNIWKEGCRFGVYKYDVTFPICQISGNPLHLSFTIWQHFLFPFYLGNDIAFPDNLRYLKHNGEFISPVYPESVWDTILSHLLALKEQFPLIYVLWGHTYNDEGEKTIIENCAYIRSKLSKHNIPELFHKNINTISDNASIAIIDLFTYNKDIKTYIPNLFSIICDKTPFITYISLKKEYDFDEAHAIFEDDRKKKVEELEKIKKELERKEAEKKVRSELPSRLYNCVNSWYCSVNGLRYNYLVDYFPTNRYDNVTEDVWNNRWTVWNFKNTPGKISSERHDEVLGELIPRLTDMLEETFGDLINQLTLVCVPASSKVNNTARYKEFSSLLCNNTGMSNSYDQIKILKDAIPKHLGGTGKPDLSFSSEYFKGRCVLLFDDVITTGRSIEKFKRLLESVGATVIAALSIGKTIR